MKVRIIKDGPFYFMDGSKAALKFRKDVFDIPDRKAKAWIEVCKWWSEIQDQLEVMYVQRTRTVDTGSQHVPSGHGESVGLDEKTST